MDTFKLRFFLFLFGCIGTRTLLTILSAHSKGWFLKFLGIMALFPVIGWFYIMFIGERDTGLEVFGGKIWWQKLRPIHALLWAFFAYLAIGGNDKAWIVLATDTAVGLTAFLSHHFVEGNLKKMLQ